MKHLLPVAVFVTVSISAMLSQEISVNRQNKTIAVTADESVTADAEIAVVEIGYHNYALTQDAAFRENVRISNQITDLLLGSGIPKVNIETEKLNLQPVQPESTWSPETKKARQFEARQSWHITLPVAQAQNIVDLAVSKGANEVEDVDWDVTDPVALQAKASGAALAKAHAIAEMMAKGLGAQLGELVYASNRAPVPKFLQGVQFETSQVSVSGEKKPQLTLFPQKVKSDATVYAVFAIEERLAQR